MVTAQSSYEVYRLHRDKQGMTDYQVARGAGLSPSTLSEWKHGMYMPKFDKLVKIARLLGFPVEEFAA